MVHKMIVTIVGIMLAAAQGATSQSNATLDLPTRLDDRIAAVRVPFHATRLCGPTR